MIYSIELTNTLKLRSRRTFLSQRLLSDRVKKRVNLPENWMTAKLKSGCGSLLRGQFFKIKTNENREMETFYQ